MPMSGRAGRNQMFGYRANVLFGGGEAFGKNSDLTAGWRACRRRRPFANTVVEAFYSYYNVEQRGFPAGSPTAVPAPTPFIKVPGMRRIRP
jgi:hypothetical protein